MNKSDYIIRLEQPGDYRKVESIIRDAFWNLHVPGCSEHYFAHVMRTHSDFIPELDLVIEIDGQIAGSVMYTKSRLVDECGESKDILTFGPVAIRHGCQRKGLGKALLARSFEMARGMGYDVIVIFGSPGNYVSSGFVSCKKHNICLGDSDAYPAALLVKELVHGALDGRKWHFYESPVCGCCEDAEAVARFDAEFPPKEKCWQPSQEEFYIQSHSTLF